MLAAAFALGLASGPAPQAPTAEPAAIELTIAELRAMIGEPQAAAAASPIAAGGYSLACAPTPKAAQVETSCRFARRLGQITLHPTFELAGHVRLKELRLELADGRIAGVAFRTSPDAYDAVLMLLDKAYGEPRLSHAVVRTELGPRDQVKLVWSAGGRVSRAVDPAPPDLDLLVDLHG